MAVREYIGARYVPKFSDLNNGDWDNQYSYEALEIVKNGNDFYTAKKPVPPGVDISDTTYWALTGNYNGAISTLQQEIDAINATVKTPELFGAVGDGVTDDTAAINSALAGGGLVVFKEGATYLVNPDVSLKPDNNSILELNGATIKAKPVASDYYEIIYLEKVSNVVVRDGIIIGERDSHLGATGEWGMGIYVGGSNDVLIDNMDISKCWGDGVYIGDTKTYENIKCKNIRVSNCVIDNCRRQGVSVTYAEDVIISDNLIKNTNGTAPEAGVDVEPNANLSVKHIIITNNILLDNMFSVAVSGAASGAAVEDVIISDNIMKAASSTRDIIRLHTVKNVVIDSNIISDSHTTGALVYTASIDGCSFTNNNIEQCQSGGTSILWAVTSGSMTGNRFNQVTVSTGEFLYILSGNSNMISDNLFQNITTAVNEYVIYLAGSSDNVFKNNQLMLNTAQYGIAFGNNANSNHIINNMLFGTYDVTIYSRTNTSTSELVSFNDIQSGANGATGGAYGFMGTVAANIIDGAYVA